MRRIALINQKGGVGKTTTAVNLGAALASLEKRVLVIDLDPQANLTVHLGVQLEDGAPSTYRCLLGQTTLAEAIRPTDVPRLSIVPTDLDLSGAELELAGAFGRERLLGDAIDEWLRVTGEDSVDYVLIDCPPSLGLLSINGLAAVDEVFVPVQTEFFALQGMSKLVEIIELVKRRMHPGLTLRGIVPCLYDSRLKLAREVLAEIRRYFPGLVFQQSIGANVKLAEAPSFGRTIFQHAPESSGARDYRGLALEVLAQEADEADTADRDGTPESAEALREVELAPAAADTAPEAEPARATGAGPERPTDAAAAN